MRMNEEHDVLKFSETVMIEYRVLRFVPKHLTQL